MIIDCIADLHGFYPPLEGGDLLIVAGDITTNNKVKEWMEFYDWFKSTNYEQKVLVAGNHDGFLERCISSQEARNMGLDEQEGFEYLCDTGIEFGGFNIWGSPWTPRFGPWSFMLDSRGRMREKWDKIPFNTDILVTHGPPFGVLDKTYDGRYAGCRDLSAKLLAHRDLKVHVFGHIHESYGQCHLAYDDDGKPWGHLSVNCSIMNEKYEPVNKPIRIIL